MKAALTLTCCAYIKSIANRMPTMPHTNAPNARWGVDMRTTPHVCGYCGKRSGKLTERKTVIERREDFWTTHVENLRVLRQTSHEHGSDHMLTNFTLWDGESYRDHRYGAFCTLICARHFANACYDSGMRIATHGVYIGTSHNKVSA